MSCTHESIGINRLAPGWICEVCGEPFVEASERDGYRSALRSIADQNGAKIIELESRLDSATQNHESQLGIMRMQRERILELERRLDKIGTLARAGRETSQFTHARAALDAIIKETAVERREPIVCAACGRTTETGLIHRCLP